MKQNLKIFCQSIVLLILFSLPSHAASILAICSANSSVSNCKDSKLFFPVYKTKDGITTFKYRIDQGNLGDLGNAETVSITENLLEKWAAESSLVFTRTGNGFLDSDINASNYTPILEPNSPLGYSPVIWDSDGTIIEDLLGTEARGFVLGFAGATCYNSSNIGTSCSGVSGDIRRVVESQTLLNGHLFNGDNTGDSASTILDDFKTTLLHEFAHMFSIDHTQGGNLEGFNNRPADLTDLPVMFPAAANPLEDLQQDDIAAVRQAYPVGDEATKFGTITGRLLKINKKGKKKLIKGANIVAFKVGESNPRKLAVAAPSDSDGRGNFIIPGLLPGTYVLFAEPIDSSFTSGSSIGLHPPISSSNMTSGFYNGENKTIIKTTNLETGLEQGENISITVGETIADINFVTDTKSKCNFPEEDSATFYLCSKLTRKAIPIKFSKKKIIQAKLVNMTKGEKRTLTFSTDYPDLITFRPETLNFSKISRKIKIKIASYLNLVGTFPELNDFEEVTIPVTITDTTTGYIDNGNSLIIF